MTQTEPVIVQTEGQTRTVVGGESGPWWAKFAMQAGFMAVLIMVLFGVYRIIMGKLPEVAAPVNKIADLAAEGEKHLERQAAASERAADAAIRQAQAIERWVQLQDIRRISSTYGPPLPTATP